MCSGLAAGSIFIEHVRSDDPRVAKMQDRMNPINRFTVCCDCNRPTLDTGDGVVRGAGDGVTAFPRPRASHIPRPSPNGFAAGVTDLSSVTKELALQLELCLPRLLSSPEP